MSKWFKTGIFLILIIAVASGSAIYKKSQRFEKCDFDGVHIKPIYRVDAILKNNDAKGLTPYTVHICGFLRIKNQYHT